MIRLGFMGIINLEPHVTYVTISLQECLAYTHGQVWEQGHRRGNIMLELEQRTSELWGSGQLLKESAAKMLLHIDKNWTLLPQVHPWWDAHDKSCFPPKRPSERDHRNRVQQDKDSVFLQRKPQPHWTWPSTKKSIWACQQANMVKENRPGFFRHRHYLKTPKVARMQPCQISLLVRTKRSKEWNSAKSDGKWT